MFRAEAGPEPCAGSGTGKLCLIANKDQSAGQDACPDHQDQAVIVEDPLGTTLGFRFVQLAEDEPGFCQIANPTAEHPVLDRSAVAAVPVRLANSGQALFWLDRLLHDHSFFRKPSIDGASGPAVIPLPVWGCRLMSLGK